MKEVSRDECWLWAGKLNLDGYGYLYEYSAGKNTTYGAHRVVFENDRQRIPEGLTLDHLCSVRRCINPEHLEVVTQRVNLLRGNTVAGNNSRKTHCPRGHKLSSNNIKKDNRGYRSCRTCHNLRERKRYWDKRSASLSLIITLFIGAVIL